MAGSGCDMGRLLPEAPPRENKERDRADQRIEKSKRYIARRADGELVARSALGARATNSRAGAHKPGVLAKDAGFDASVAAR